MLTVFKATLLAGSLLLLAGCGSGSGTTPPPGQGVTITVQPLSQTVPVGQTAVFSVTATGTAQITYQWSENGETIPGATSASYTTPAVELGAGGTTSIGSFQVTVSNSVDSVTSNIVSLTAGPRSPKAGDLRYLLYQQVDVPGLLNGSASGAGGISSEGSFQSEAVNKGLGSPLSIGDTVCAVSSGFCGWTFEYQILPSPVTGFNMYYQPGDYLAYISDLESYAASHVVFTSLDLDPAENAYAVSWVSTTESGGFDYRMDPLVPPGANQQAQIQAQAALDGTESRVITAASFDASGNAVLLSYGWQGDTTTVYETQTSVVAPGQVIKAATNLANEGYIISAFGGNDTNGYILIAMRVLGDSLPRPTTDSVPVPAVVPYYSPVVYFSEYNRPDAVLFEQ